MLERTAKPGTAELQHCRAAAGTAGELLFLSLNLHPGNARGVVRFDREQLLLGQIRLVKEKKPPRDEFISHAVWEGSS